MRIVKSLLALISFIFVATLTGCATTGAKIGPTLQPGETGVYIFRNKVSASVPEVYLDGRLLGKLENHGSVSSSLEPGTHRLHINKAFFIDKAVNFDFDIKRGQILYIQMSWGTVAGEHIADDAGPKMVPNQNWKFKIVSKLD